MSKNLICWDCQAVVNPQRIFMGGSRFICINCEHIHDTIVPFHDGPTRFKLNKGKNKDNSPVKRSRSFINRNRGNKP